MRYTALHFSFNLFNHMRRRCFFLNQKWILASSLLHSSTITITTTVRSSFSLNNQAFCTNKWAFAIPWPISLVMIIFSGERMHILQILCKVLNSWVIHMSKLEDVYQNDNSIRVVQRFTQLPLLGSLAPTHEEPTSLKRLRHLCFIWLSCLQIEMLKVKFGRRNDTTKLMWSLIWSGELQNAKPI